MGVGKYLAAAMALLLMGWTWNLGHKEGDLGLEGRRAIEATLEETIVQYIKARKPQVTDVVFQQLFSEDLSPKEPGTKELLVRFRYLTNEPALSGEMTEQTFEGSVRLKSKDGSTWEWIDDEVRSPLLRYKNGAEVKAVEDPAK